MTTFYLTCEAVEATLPDYLDETLEPWVRASIEEHLGECWRCAGLARELRNITREASALPALVPERDPWGEIAGRIGAPVSVATPVAESEPIAPTPEPIVVASEASIPIGEPSAVASEPPVVMSEPAAPASEPLPPSRPARVPKATPVHALSDRRAKRWGPGRMGLAAAALVLVTAGTTSLFTVQWLRRARAPDVATDAGARGLTSSERAAAEPGIRAPDSSVPTLPAGQVGSALTVAATSAPQLTRSPEEAVYDKEINMLQGVVRRQRSGLDASTVVVIEKNLRAIDSAIAQIRAAMQKDPGNALLGGQASRALEMKVELLRRAAMLRSSTLPQPI